MIATAFQQNTSLARTDWKRVAARMRAELERADLNERARAVAAWAIRPTLLRGRSRVVIPNRAAVCGVLGISTKHMAEVIQELAAAGVLTLREVHEGWELLVYPDAAMWSVRMKWERNQMDALLRTIDDAPGQVQGELLDAEAVSNRGPCLDRARAEVAVANVAHVPDLGTSMVAQGGIVPLRVSEFRSSKPYTKLLTPELSKGRTAPNPPTPSPSREGNVSEAEVVARCAELFGEKMMVNWGGAWRNRHRQNPDKLKRVLDAVAEDMRTSTVPIRNPSGHANDLWKRFHE